MKRLCKHIKHSNRLSLNKAEITSCILISFGLVAFKKDVVIESADEPVINFISALYLYK